jgi:hypothetical protein
VDISNLEFLQIYGELPSACSPPLPPEAVSLLPLVPPPPLPLPLPLPLNMSPQEQQQLGSEEAGRLRGYSSAGGAGGSSSTTREGFAHNGLSATFTPNLAALQTALADAVLRSATGVSPRNATSPRIVSPKAISPTVAATFPSSLYYSQNNNNNNSHATISAPVSAGTSFSSPRCLSIDSDAPGGTIALTGSAVLDCDRYRGQHQHHREKGEAGYSNSSESINIEQQQQQQHLNGLLLAGGAGESSIHNINGGCGGGGFGSAAMFPGSHLATVGGMGPGANTSTSNMDLQRFFADAHSRGRSTTLDLAAYDPDAAFY